jgi:hypothetical protein
MDVVFDSGAIIALYFDDDRNHAACLARFSGNRDSFVIPSPLLSEIDYLLMTRAGPQAQSAFLDDLRSGVYGLDRNVDRDLQRISAILETYKALKLGFADASVMAAAERLGTEAIFTTDLRHFRAVRSVWGRPFRLLPWD